MTHRGWHDGAVGGNRGAGGARLVGVDLARLTAVVGMMAAHTLSRSDPPAAVVALIDGPPSTLFAVLGGVSVVLATRARLAIGDRGGALRSTLARGFAVAVLGFLIIPLAPAVYVVLVPFGVAIMATAVLVLLPSWLLTALAVILAAGSGWIAALSRQQLPGLDRSHSFLQLFTEPLGSLNDVLLSGVYPALAWTDYLLIGMLVARAILAARRTGRERLALAGIAVAGAALTTAGLVATELGLRILAAGSDPAHARDVLLANAYGAVPSTEPAWQLLAAPHSGTPADIARTAGIALVVIAVLSLLASVLPASATRLIEPLRAAGGAPLTIYIVHVVLLSVLGGLLIEAAPGAVGGWVGLAVQVAVALAIGAVLAASGARGPFERLVGLLADRAGGLHRAAAPIPHWLPDELSIAYEFRVRAPIERVWDAYTDPAAVPRWLADPTVPIVRCTMDVRVGGGYRFEHGALRQPVVGEYLRVEPPVLLQQTMRGEIDGGPGTTGTVQLAEHGGVTTVRVHERYASRERRDAGLRELRFAAAAYDRFTALVER